MEKVLVPIPKELWDKLEEREPSPEEAVVKAVEEWLARQYRQYQDKRVREIIQRFSSPLGEWAREFARENSNITPAELRERLKGVPPLSEIIIAERDEGR